MSSKSEFSKASSQASNQVSNQNSAAETSSGLGTTRVPTIIPFSPALLPLKERLESCGFSVCVATDSRKNNQENNQENNQKDIGIALVPLSGDAELGDMTTQIERYRARFPDTVFVGVYSGKLRFKANEAYRTGLSCIYSVPLEEEQLINKIFEIVPSEFEAKDLTFDQLLRVNVIELERARSLKFDLYLFLPMNKKIILYIEKNRPIEDKALQKFRDHPHYSLYIRRSQLKKYLSYCNDLLVAGSEEFAEIDRGRRVASRLAGLLGGFFNDESISEEESNGMLENLKNMIGPLADQSGKKKDLIQAVTQYASQQMTHFTHAQNVAAYCCLFGMAVGINEPETLRMGGLLHDLGLSDLPNDQFGRELSEMSADQAAKYKLHPGGGKFSIEERKLKVPKMAMDMVLLHHEQADGNGYPYGKKSDEIPLAAKICAFADEFDKLTSVRIGKRQFSPLAAMQRLAGLDGKPPSPVFEMAVHQPIIDMFIPPKAQIAPTAPSGTSMGSSVEKQKHAPTKSGTRATIESYLKQPRFVAREARNIGESSPALKAVLHDLQSQLNDHWKGKRP